jgi:HEAT repeat protein
MNKAPKQALPKRSLVVPAFVIGVLIIVAALGYKGYQSSLPASAPPSTSDNASHSASEQLPASQLAEAHRSASTQAESAPAPTPTPSVPGPTSPPPESAPADPKDLVSGLAALDGKQPITPEQAQKWKDSLQQLVRQGSASVPAIQQFLAQNQDANYAGVSGATALGYNSLRSAMLDALAQIGGPDATAAMLQIMQSSVFPTDISTLAKTLDAQGGGQYQQSILDAVRQQLNLAAVDQLGDANVLPLFQVLANEAANGANVSSDLTQFSEKWPYYSAIALASLPDGAGVPSLVQIAQGAVAGNPSAAAQALAELAPQNPQALSSLLDLAKGGQMTDSALAQLAPFLAGREFQLGPPQDPAAGGYMTYHIAGGNQDFSAFDSTGALTQPQITERLSLIDQFLQAIPSGDSAAQDALQQQRNSLIARQKQ